VRARCLASVLIVALCALWPSAGASATEADRGHGLPKSVERGVNAAVDRAHALGVPGTAVFVAVKGRGTYARYAGHASLDPAEKVTSATRFRIGSITKTFTATVILQLVQQGKLRLSDTIDAWVPNAPNADRVKVKNLLNMTSGIYDEGGPGSLLSAASPDRCWKPDEIVALAARQGTGAPIGTFYYSDTNYIILGMIAERVTGKPLRALFERRIIKPLKLRDTVYPDLCSSEIPAPAARGYEVTIEGLTGGEGPRYRRISAPAVKPSALGPAGALISSVRDLRVWAEALGTGKLLNRRVEHQRLQTGGVFSAFLPLAGVGVPESFELPARYGLGIARVGGYLGHNGAVAPGFLADAWYAPSTGTTIIVLENATPTYEGQLVAIPDGIFTAIAALLRT
jgi:D-alanyl-D-alanine carboxypeptidase